MGRVLRLRPASGMTASCDAPPSLSARTRRCGKACLVGRGHVAAVRTPAHFQGRKYQRMARRLSGTLASRTLSANLLHASLIQCLPRAGSSQDYRVLVGVSSCGRAKAAKRWRELEGRLQV